MERNRIVEGLRKIIAEELDVAAPAELNESDRLNEDLNLDSIMILQLAVYIEEYFEVAFPEDDVDPGVFATVGSLTDFIVALHVPGAALR
ncbi:acyl carrier protein [Paenibacillus endophyticus]|uniref:Acyl carrier protein n=1 Tax=Paenibacillus endophyticus TaxID=1294268 RepID=A0A7W5GBP1_9BACL|nr:phosphopantetheine-binding protein [Paenibacillus endophyticus]MBB3153608.1 acyl carrier protein [Paenibacillus endophyticus]